MDARDANGNGDENDGDENNGKKEYNAKCHTRQWIFRNTHTQSVIIIGEEWWKEQITWKRHNNVLDIRSNSKLVSLGR